MFHVIKISKVLESKTECRINKTFDLLKMILIYQLNLTYCNFVMRKFYWYFIPIKIIINIDKFINAK